jgi:glycosyltransferase involved in cell wall biosynthesis
MKLKVLHIINSLTIGGAEILLVNSLAEGGLPEHLDNTLVYLQGTSALEARIDKRVNIHCLHYKGPVNLLQTLWRLRKIIKDNKIDIVHSHLNPTSFYANLARPKHVPQLHTVHIAYTADKETRPILKYLEQKLYFNKPYCNLVHLSEFTKTDFLRALPFKGHTYVLNNFIADEFFDHEPKTYQGNNTRALRMLAVGNFRDQKNYGYLLNIFSYLKDHAVHLDIYGGGNATTYQQLIDEQGLHVTIKGPVKNINEVIADYDLFIMSSTNEGFPLSVFEAMAAGIPLMLSDIEPLQSIVKEHAIYFKLDDAQTAAAQILEILQNKRDINTMAVQAKAYAAQTVRRDIYIKNLLQIYKQL